MMVDDHIDVLKAERENYVVKRDYISAPGRKQYWQDRVDAVDVAIEALERQRGGCQHTRSVTESGEKVTCDDCGKAWTVTSREMTGQALLLRLAAAPEPDDSIEDIGKALKDAGTGMRDE